MKPYDEQNAQKIIKFWQGHGLSNYAVAGWLSNWLIESGFRSNNAQNTYMSQYGITDEEYTQRVDDGTWAKPDTADTFKTDSIGYGLAQWTSSGRKSGLYDYIKSKGLSIADFDSQLEWAWLEYTSKGYKECKEGLETCTSAGDAAVIIMRKFEKPASVKDPKKVQERYDLAEEFYQLYFAAEPVKKKRVLALSAGHYLYTAGKRCDKRIDPLETREWVLNARIADMLTDKLMKYDGIEILRLDDPTGENPISLEERAKKSDNHQADFYLAIHHNAAREIFNGGGVVVYHYPLDRNLEQATELYNDVVDANGLRGNRSRPIVSTTELYEVCVPKADSILLENGFMNSWTDTPIILTEQFAENTAKGLCKFFVDYWKLELKKDESASDILAEIESIRNNIKALEVELDKKLVELGAMLK